MKVFLFALVLSASLFDKSFCSNDDDLKGSNDTSSFYTAAVLEFYPPGDKFSDPQEIVDANLAEYLSWIDEASERGADILVFSEASLNYKGISSRENLSKFAVELSTDVPDTSECDYSHNTILSELSFAAANASIYVLVNVVEMEACNENESCSSDRIKLFNTNLVFDRSGCIISRYRKFNLFVEPNMNITDKPEIATFETDFGVTFGHFVCFDILFKSPALDIINMNVSHILYPSMWFSEIPFLASVQIQQSFAQRNNIVLLSSGANSPSTFNTGSGIFVGRHGAIEKLISSRNESRLMIAEIPKNVDDEEYEPVEPSVKPYTADEMDSLKLWHYVPKKSFPLHKNFVSSYGGAKCEFTLNYTKLEIDEGSVGYGYRLAVFAGIRNFGGVLNGGEVYCAIVSCLNSHDERTCGRRVESKNLVPSFEFHSIHIKTTIDDDAENYLVMPTSLDFAVNPLSTQSYEYSHQVETKEQIYSIKSTKVLSDLMTFGIFGRNFKLDGKISPITAKKEDDSSSEEEEEEASESEETDDFFTSDTDSDNDLQLKMTIYVVLTMVLSVITSIMVYRKLQHPYVKPEHMNKRKSCA